MKPSKLDTAALLLWLGLMLAPNLAVLAFANAWEVSAPQLAMVSAWIIACMWAFVPRRSMLVLTAPVLLLGLMVVGADMIYGADLVELLSVWHTFRQAEVTAAMAPHAGLVAVAVLATAALGALLWRPAASRAPLPVKGGIVVLGLVLALALPAANWRGAWPVALLGAAVSGSLGDAGIQLPARESVRATPRDRLASWQARRGQVAATHETYVLVIGESVRSDRLPACGGRAGIAPAPQSALVYCDVISGSSSTHTAVPLLISRGLPGTRDRVPHDASFLKAFEEVGFDTFWFGVQERSIAWPDARHQAYVATPQLDRDALLPLLDEALAKPSPRKLIVLHAYNAHAPYSERYSPDRAPFRVDRGKAAGASPHAADIDTLWNEYDNAIDESMRLLQEVASRLRAQAGESFLAYTPDHAENMRDDARGLRLHALKAPTLWDTAVPGIVWANQAWRDAHPGKWSMLESNREAALMHMDFVPTLLGAAGIEYREPRHLAIDLTAAAVPARRARFTQLRAGQTITVEAMRAQATGARP